MAIYARSDKDLDGLVHHSDRGVQYLAIRYTERLSEAGVGNSVGSKGDSYDNAMAESFNGLYKTELIHRKGPWENVDHVEWATLTDVDWFNNRRIHNEIGRRLVESEDVAVERDPAMVVVLIADLLD
jgi:putative transposase